MRKIRRIRRALLTATFLALVTAPAASAHFGDIWYDTAARTAGNIEDKFPRVAAARCFPLPQHLRARFNAHSFVRNSVRYWDHFACALAINGGSTCISVAHITGQRWSDFYLTSFPVQGCTPYQLRG